jgi:hypothetical protein
MNAHDEDRMKELLQQALPRVDVDAGPGRNLWPAIQKRVDEQPAAMAPFHFSWFDWALAAGLVAFVAFVPSSIPVILYYL